MFVNFSTGISDFNSSFSAWLPEASPIQSELVNACSAFLDRGLPTHIHPSMQKRMNEFFGEDCLGPLKLCHYLLTKGVTKNGTETVFG